MRLSEQGKYSATAQRYSKQICKKLQEHFPKQLRTAVITDACAGNGGDTVVFATRFLYVNAVEKDPNEFEYLSGNVKFSKLQNVVLINDSCLNIGLTQDIIYFDPPWGGPEYKSKNNVDLYLDQINIGYIIAGLIASKSARLIAVKVPHNFNFREFEKIIQHKLLRNSMNKFDLILIRID